MRYTLQHEQSPRSDFLSLQTNNNWRLRWDCQETRDKNKNGLDKGEWHRGRQKTEEKKVREVMGCSNSGKRGDGVTINRIT